MAMAMATTSSHGSQSASSCSVSINSHISASKPDGSSGDTFPAGLRVLVVDDDPICLLILDRMLRRCQYQVTTCGRATDALAKLRENPENFDVILSDVCMPDMDGFKLLELVGLEMDLPVIMMSANGETSAVMKGIKHGACDYLLKPVRMEELRNIWQHVVRKRFKNSVKMAKQEDARNKQNPSDGDYNSANEAFDGPSKQSGRKRKDSRDEDDEVDLDNDEISTTKKPRVVWSVELHQQFVNAVNQLGVDKAVPKRILELMNVQGLTRENVASHLQKYRLYLKRISGVSHQSGALITAYSISADAHYGSVNPGDYMGLNELHRLSGPNQLSSQSLGQAGMLGRLAGPSNNLGIGNVDPALILQMSALQDMKNSPLTRSMPMSYSQPLHGAPYSGMADLDQLRGIDNPVSQSKVSRIVSGLQQHQAHQGLPAVSDSNNFQHLKKNVNALLMHPVPQEDMGGHLSNKSDFNMPIMVQQGLESEADAWGSSTSATSGIGSSYVTGHVPGGLVAPGSVHSLPRACNIQNVHGAPNSIAVSSVSNVHMPHAGNAAMINSSSICSPLSSSGADDTRNHGSKHIDSNLLQLNENIPDDLGQHYAMLAALKHGEGLHGNLGNQVIPQAVSIAADHTQINSQHVQSPLFSLPSSSGFNIPGHDRSEFHNSPGLIMVSQSGQFKVENNYDKNHEWFAEPLNDDLLSIVLKQEHNQYTE